MRDLGQKSALILISVSILISAISSAQAQTKVYLLAGQSNMVGWSDSINLPPELQQPRPDIQIYWQGNWYDLQPGLGGNSSKFGPEITLGRNLADVQPDENIVLVKYAVSGTSLWNQWNPTDGVEYVNFINAVEDALLSISDPGIAGMFWMQGESDAYPPHSTLSYAQAYEQNLTDFIDSVRSDFNAPDMPFAIGQISESPLWTWGDIVRQAQLNVSQTLPNSSLVITSDLALLPDGMHYDSEGMTTLSSRFANAMYNLELDTSKASSSSESTTLSWTHTISSSNNRILVVAVAGEDSDPCDLVISSVTYNTVNMDLIEQTTQSVYSSDAYTKTELYYLPDSNLPLSGPYTVEIIYSGNVSKICAGAVTLKDLAQQSAESVAVNSEQDANTISTDITALTEGATIVDVVGCSNSGSFTIAAGNNQTEQFDISSDSSTAAAGTKQAATAGPVTMSWTFSDGNSAIVHSVAAFTPTARAISGYILEPNDTPIEGALVAPDSGGDPGITASDGYYEVLVPHAWTGTVTATKAERIFKPSQRTYNKVTDDLQGQNYEDISIYDLDSSGSIEWGDITLICENWLSSSPETDFNNDGIVNLRDFAEFALAW